MNIKILKNIGFTIAGILLALYGLFLVLPFIISPIVNNYVPMVNDEIKKTTGFSTQIEGFRLVTTPKLTIGAKLNKLAVFTPEEEKIIEAEGFDAKMSLLPLFAKRIEADLVKLASLEVKLGLNKDGSFEIEKYFPKAEPIKNTEKVQETQTTTVEPIVLPFGLRLSNKLPDLKLGEYDIELKDISTGKIYEVEGEKTELTNFVLNKSVKILASGKASFAGREQFAYNIKVNNKIMPDIDLHELVFPSEPVKIEAKKNTAGSMQINVLEILKGLYNYHLTAKLDTDLTITPSGNNGYVNLSKLSISPNGLDLPEGNVKLDFKGNKIDINSKMYTAQNEASNIVGYVKTGKKPDVNIDFKSQAQLNNIIRIINAFAMTFNFKDLQTLSANGNLDANFNIKSNMKTLASNGYLRIPNANIKYGLYDVNIDNINADVLLDNNNVNIKNVGFSVLGQPLKFFGTVSDKAVMDLHLVADKLSLKGLLVALGQAVLLKDNKVNSGTITLNADIVGTLDKIKPTAKIALNDIDIKNVPIDTNLKLPNTAVNIVSDGKTFSGTALSENIKVINPAASVSIPRVTAGILPEVITISKTPVVVEKIKFDVEGKVKNYLTEKIGLNFVTTGDIKSTLTGDMNVVKQTLNLVFNAQNSTIIIPMFDKSKMTFNGNIGIGGSMLNPILTGIVNVPSINIPEIPIVMENLVAKLHGPILNGSATLAKFGSGGIVAENLTTDFSLKGENFYLNGLKGTAFDGKISGNIICNLSSLKTTIDFKGEGLNAEKAVEGAIGISNALTGTLGFNTKLSLLALDYEEMMKSLKGNLSFKIANGSFGSIGRIENFFAASNIANSSILKATVASLSNLTGLKDAAKYDYISGDLDFNYGWANLKNIKSAGPTLAYYVTGKYNLINATTNVVILGRLHSSIVSSLGVLGELSADVLLGQIPKFGALTASIVNTLTANPKGENIAAIPALTGATPNNYKDFKVSFNGGIDSTSSIKSFKWLTEVDTSALEPVSVVDTIKSLKTTVNSDLTNTVKGVADTISSQKEALKSTANELKSLFKF